MSSYQAERERRAAQLPSLLRTAPTPPHVVGVERTCSPSRRRGQRVHVVAIVVAGVACAWLVLQGVRAQHEGATGVLVTSQEVVTESEAALAPAKLTGAAPQASAGRAFRGPNRPNQHQQRESRRATAGKDRPEPGGQPNSPSTVTVPVVGPTPVPDQSPQLPDAARIVPAAPDLGTLEGIGAPAS